MAPRKMPRGALASPRHVLAAAVPHQTIGITPPNYIYIPQQISYWGNETDGDCVTAEEAFAKACYRPEIFIAEQQAVAWATQNNFLNGAVISDALNVMLRSGFQQDEHMYCDGGARSVDWTNAGVLQNAIFQGPVKLGIAGDQLNDAWNAYNGTTGWVATGFHADSNEDHCVSLCGYGSLAWLAEQLQGQVPGGLDGTLPAYAVFTWNSTGIIDVPSLLAITHEAWLRTPTTVVN
ncbi:hypothetical protein [Bradyrhizobium sp. USDA 4502]